MGQYLAEANTDRKEVLVTFIQRRSPLPLTGTWGRHVPFRSRDDLDWKNHVTAARQRKIRGPHLCWPFCFLTTIRNTPSLKDHPTGGTYSIKTWRKRGCRKAECLQRAQDLSLCICGEGWGGTPLPLPGFVTDCLQGWLCCSWKHSTLGERYVPRGLQPPRWEPTPPTSLTSATINRSTSSNLPVPDPHPRCGLCDSRLTSPSNLSML